MQQKLMDLYDEKFNDEYMTGGALIGAKRKKKRAVKKVTKSDLIKFLVKSAKKRTAKGRGYIGGEDYEGAALIGAKKRRTRKRKYKGKGSKGDELFELVGGASKDVKRVYDFLGELIPTFKNILRTYPPIETLGEFPIPDKITIYGKVFNENTPLKTVFIYTFKIFKRIDTEPFLGDQPDITQLINLNDRVEAYKMLADSQINKDAAAEELFKSAYPGVSSSIVPLIKKIAKQETNKLKDLFFLT